MRPSRWLGVFLLLGLAWPGCEWITGIKDRKVADGGVLVDVANPNTGDTAKTDGKLGTGGSIGHDASNLDTGDAPLGGSDLGAGGVTGTGGALATGGSTAPRTDGGPDSRDAPLGGSDLGAGGIGGSGGVPATGGNTAAGTDGGPDSRDAPLGGSDLGAGGVTGTGGIASTGGIAGTGGIASTGGIAGTGGIASTGGAGGIDGGGGAGGQGGMGDAGGVPTNGLVGEWLFDQGDARDTSGNGLDGTINGAVPAPDRFGQAKHAFHFDGVSQSILVPSSAPLHFAGDHTISVWIRPAGFSALAGIVSKYQNYASAGFMLRFGGGTPYDYLDFEEIGAPSAKVVANQWQHVAAVRQAGMVKIYLQGTLILLTPGSYTPVANDDPLGIGVDYSSRYYYGDIDDVRLYNRALSDAEVAVLSGN